MIRRIVILGGSFNPLTIAHYRLMQAAMAQIGAVRGIFVPVGHAYLKRKMRKAAHPLCLSDTRLAMLRAMCSGTPGLEVSDIEMRDPTLYTEMTMAALQAAEPEAKLYFLAGADKLPLIRKWTEKGAFLERFGVLLVGRDGLDLTETLAQDAVFAQYADALHVVPPPDEVADVSSTRIRAALLQGRPEEAKDALHPAVWALFRTLRAEDYPPEIERFKGEYAYLANSWPAPVAIDGAAYPCAEAAYQALRCQNAADAARFVSCKPDRVKVIAASVVPKPDWEAQCIPAMRRVLAAKFTQDHQLAQRLLETGNAVLINGGNDKDKFWGRDLYTWQGENHLGRLLMEVRDHLNAEKERYQHEA